MNKMIVVMGSHQICTRTNIQYTIDIHMQMQMQMQDVDADTDMDMDIDIDNSSLHISHGYTLSYPPPLLASYTLVVIPATSRQHNGSDGMVTMRRAEAEGADY